MAPRPQPRYRQLVLGHLHLSDPLAAGIPAPHAWGLVTHDWSLPSYPGRRRKVDQLKANNRQPSSSAALRRLPVRLSGRQARRGREATAPALLAGRWVLLAMLGVLEAHSVDELRRFKQLALGATEDDTG